MTQCKLCMHAAAAVAVNKETVANGTDVVFTDTGHNRCYGRKPNRLLCPHL